MKTKTTPKPPSINIIINQPINAEILDIISLLRENLSVTKSIRNLQLREHHSRPLPKRSIEGDIWCYKKWMLLKSRSDLIESPATKEKVYNYLLERNDDKKQLLQYGVYVLPDFISAIDNGRKSENA